MERSHPDQSSIKSQSVVNYSSINYGANLFRSPNSPPPSPSPSIASLSRLFLGSRLSSKSPPQPPLLPLPRSATLPVRIHRQSNGKRKGKIRGGARMAKEEGRVAVAAKEIESVYELSSPPPSCLPFPTFSLMRTKISVDS